MATFYFVAYRHADSPTADIVVLSREPESGDGKRDWFWKVRSDTYARKNRAYLARLQLQVSHVLHSAGDPGAAAGLPVWIDAHIGAEMRRHGYELIRVGIEKASTPDEAANEVIGDLPLAVPHADIEQKTAAFRRELG